MNVFKVFFITITAATLLSCRKYVENVPVQGQRVLVYTNDYRLLINSREDSEYGSANAAIMGCDDIDLKNPNLQNDISFNSVYVAQYTWAKPFYIDKEDDFDWNSMYKAIYTYNTVISGVLESKNGSLEEQNAIYAEALVQRAFTYFTLVNSHGKQYDASTADTDLGVPLLLEAKLFVNLRRATVAQVYAQVLQDIETAIPLLPTAKKNSVNPYRGSAYALLAKVHLNMRNFEAARVAAEQALALSNGLNDYKLIGNAAFPTLMQNKEVLLRKIPRLSYSALQLSADLLNLLGTKDLRYKLFTKAGNDNYYPSFAETERGFFAGAGADNACVGLTVGETWLIRAECLARAGRRDEAVKMLNDLRKFRFSTSDYVDLSASSDQDALKLVVEERRRELFGTGLRWFDQKRLNKEAAFAKTVTRTFNGTTYTLLPNSNAYVFPLSSIIVNQNPELVQNPN